MNIEASNSRNTPTYLAHYDMRRAPFASRIESDMYYSDSTLTQRLDLLLHLTQYGNELLLVTAEDGGGKTSMLHTFIQKAQTNWSVGHITANDSSNKELFIKQIYRQFKLEGESHSKSVGRDEDSNKNISSKKVKHHLTTYLLSNRRVVLLVDDADKLSNDALELLLDLSSIIHHDKSSLQVILFCHPSIKIQLAAPELEQKRFLKQRKIDLPKLTKTQTDELIQHRLNNAGMKASKIFTRSTINRIYKTTKGNPDHICEIAHQILTDSTPKARHRFFTLDYILHPPFPVSGNTFVFIAFAIIVGAIMYFHDSINTIFENSAENNNPEKVVQTKMVLDLPIELNKPPANLPLASVKPILLSPPVVVDDSNQLPTELENNKDFSLQGSDDTSIISAPESSSTIQPDAKKRPADIKPEPALVNLERSKPVEPISPASTKLKKLAEKITPTKAAIPVNHQTAWMLTQMPGKYTLQLLAGRKLSTINNFLQQHTLPSDKIAYYLSYNNGKALHSLVYGIYPNRDTARLAIKSLPPKLVAAKPWIRKLHYIHRDINNAVE